MKNKVYINGVASVSAQPEAVPFLVAPKEYKQSIIPALPVDFKKHIAPMSLRRMSKAVKMGLLTSKLALKEANVAVPDAIITGTGEGCLQDTEKFLQRMLDQEEQLLSPTSFIQSTHNTIGGQIALALKCTGYNMTFTHGAASLESALLDALLCFEENLGRQHILVGGVEEIAKKSTPHYYLDGQLKKEAPSNLELLNSSSPGTITSEGAHFFSLSNKASETTYAELCSVKIIHILSEEMLSFEIIDFLKENQLEPEALDAIILGNNGDFDFDKFYHVLKKGIFQHISQLAYKHLVGDYDTVSGYAMMLAAKILKTGRVPETLKINGQNQGSIQNILIYNQYRGKNHSFILLKKV